MTKVNNNPQVVFISGGSKGIGRATVELALKQGWHVAFSYSTNQNSAEQLTQNAAKQYPNQLCRAYLLDIKNNSQLETVSEQIIDDFDTINAVVCNAGIDIPGNIATFSDEDWHLVLNTNLTGTFNTIRCFLPLFIANRYGRFVTLSSLAKDGASGQAAYAASKAGIVGLTQTTAKEYASYGVAANTVVPGLIETDILSDDPKNITQFFKTYGPSKRLGNCDEVAQAVMFLCSQSAEYINGTVLNVTGGSDWVF